jgi:hypothetical protein
VVLTVLPNNFSDFINTRSETIMLAAYIHSDDMANGRSVDARLPMEIIPEHSLRSVVPVVRQISRRVLEEKIEARYADIRCRSWLQHEIEAAEIRFPGYGHNE